MRARTAILTGLAALIGFAVWIAWDNAQSAKLAEAALARLHQKQAENAQKIQSAELRRVAAEKARLALQAESDAHPSNGNSPSGAASKKVAAISEEDMKAFLQALDSEKDPAVQALHLAIHRAQLASTFGLLFRTLRLTSGQIAKFGDNFIHRDEQTMDLRAIMSEQGLAFSDPVLSKLWIQNETDYQAAQRELLGDANYRQLQEYDRTASLRNVVSGFAGVATVAGVPLTPSQAEQLTQLVAAASSAHEKGQRATSDTIDWTVVDAQAGTVLDEAQLALFKTSEGSQDGRFWGQVNRLYNQAQKADAADAAGKAAQAMAKAPGG